LLKPVSLLLMTVWFSDLSVNEKRFVLFEIHQIGMIYFNWKSIFTHQFIGALEVTNNIRFNWAVNNEFQQESLSATERHQQNSVVTDCQ
jgi:hypothetical protein